MSESYLLEIKIEGQSTICGTAWFLDEKTLVTALHVVARDGEWYERDYEITYLLNGEPINLQYTAEDNKADIAFLEVVDERNEQNILTLQNRSLSPTEKWQSPTYPKFHSGKFALSGEITVTNGDNLAEEIQLIVDQGTQVDWAGISGSPLLIDNEVVGMITAITNKTRVGWATSAASIRKLWDSFREDDTAKKLAFINKHNLCAISYKSNDRIELIATGYRIATDLILTAFDTKIYTDQSKLSWRTKDLKWQPINEIKYKNNWIVLLAYHQSQAVLATPPFICQSLPNVDELWECAGFTVADDTNNVIKNWSSSGKGFAHENDDKMQCTLPKSMSNLLPGCPIFTETGLVAVVASSMIEQGKEKLIIIPCKTFVKQAKFKRHFENESFHERCERYIKQISHILDSSEKAKQGLRKRICPGQNIDSETIARKFLNCDLKQAILYCHEVKDEYLDLDNEVIQCIKKVLEQVLPLLCDFRLIDRVSEKQLDVGSALITLPIATNSMAEVIMAGFDRRRCMHIPLTSSNDFIGSYRLQNPPESGMKLAKWCDAFEKDCHDRICSFAKLESLQGLSDQNQKEVSDELLRRTTSNHETYYFIVSTTRLDIPYVELKDSIDKLKKRYSSIVFLVLDDNVNEKKKELDDLYPYHIMLPKNDDKEIR